MITRFTNIFVFNTATRQFEAFDVTIKDTTIINIGDDIIPYDVLVDGQGKYMIPGLIDSHMHIESSMTTPQEFSNTVLPLGTTTILADAHEVANVFGVSGLEDYMAQDTTLDIFWAIPSSVPSTNPRLETTGGTIDEHDVERLCHHPKVIALGEIMNFKDVTADDDNLTQRIIKRFHALKPLSPIEGHIPRISGLELSKFIMQGIGSDHTHQTPESLLEKTRLGILVQLQEKSITPEVIAQINHSNLIHRISLVTDDVLPDDLIEKGHLNYVLKKAVAMGLPINDAIYAATYTPAMRLNLFDRGIIAPGKKADFILLSNLEAFTIADVYKDGVSITAIEPLKQAVFPESSYASIKRNPLTPSDFQVLSDRPYETVRVMCRETSATFTNEAFCEVAVKDGVLQWQAAGLSLICVIERYGKHAPIQFGFVQNGFDIPAAIASSWAHDHHNILVMGSNITHIVAVVNDVIARQGSMSFSDQHGLAFISLPYGGIVSLDPMPALAHDVKTIRTRMKQAGYISHNEIMSFSVLGLLVSPTLKISEHGYVDVKTQTVKGWRL